MSAAALAASVALLVGVLAGCAPATSATSDSDDSDEEAGVVRVLQLNLCGSGVASCYTGRATTEAAETVRRERPDLVTLNEVCDGDVAVVERALAAGSPGGEVSSAFRAARDGRTGEPYRCRDGRAYGIGVVARGAAAGAPTSGIHPAQDPADPEQRAWVCLETAGAARGVCTTHLAYTDPDVALAQCRHLFDVVVPGLRAPVVVGADLNLGPRGDDDLEACLPPGAARADDGCAQQVVAPSGLAVTATALVDLRGTTDHPGLLATLASPSGGSGTVGGSPP